MESDRRLIIVPQLRVLMRYQEWWPQLFEKELSKFFGEVLVLGGTHVRPHHSKPSHFSNMAVAIHWESDLIADYLRVGLRKSDVLLHLDLSFPGLFHSVLYHKRPEKAVVFCHATAKNRFDIFHKHRKSKWKQEKAHAEMYDTVLVASEYHRNRLSLPNVVSLDALPQTPEPGSRSVPRTIEFCSTTRPCLQKVNLEVEKAVEALSGEKIHRYRFPDWKSYFHFLDRTHFLLLTPREETYGITAMDALQRGCIPIAPRAFSYPETLPDHLLYDPDASVQEKAREIMRIAEKAKGWKVTPKNFKAVEQFFPRLAEELLR